MMKQENQTVQQTLDPGKATIQNDFMFGTVMRNPKLYKKFLEVVLDVKIDRIEYPEGQKVIDLAQNAKSVRLDVYVDDDKGTIYDIEMQTTKNKNLPKRMRYYQGMIDLNILEKGGDYNALRKSIVIFICPFDPVGDDEYIYRFQNRCRLTNGTYRDLKDDTEKVFVNVAGHIGNVSQEFMNLAKYILNGSSNDAFTDELDEQVELNRSDQKWRLDFMTLLMRDLQNRDEGRAEGRLELAAELYHDGTLTFDSAVQKSGVSRDEFYDFVTEKKS